MGPDARTLIAVLRRSHERLASLASFLAAEHLTRQSYDREWTIAQVFSHLGSGAELGLVMLDSALTGAEIDGEKFPQVWDAWNAKGPQQQAADCLAANDAHITRLEQLGDAELAGITVNFAGMDLDAAGLIRLRLSEHAVHTWDVAVAIDPVAVLAPDAVELLAGLVVQFAGRMARPAGEPFRARLRGSLPGTDLPGTDLLVAAGDGVAISPWPAEGPADGAVDGEIALPAEALIRLFYGRLDPAHTPPVHTTGDSGVLGKLRAAFPGF
jgi:uncharacterized protein (TIGR03083 family)